MVIRTYFNRMADIWDEAAAERDEARLELMAERLNIKPGARVLDVGTGTGIFIPFLLGKTGSNGYLVALDIAGEMLRRAMTKGFGDNIDYVNADVNNIPLSSETFDSVVCYSSFPHFQDKMRALAEIRRVTRNGGNLFICHTSSRETINQIHNGIAEVENDFLPDDTEMQVMLADAGFMAIQIEDDREYYFCRAMKPE